MKDELQAKRDEGERIGKEIGKEIGESRVNELNRQLARAGRIEDMVKAAENREYQDRLLEEFGL